MSMQAPDYKLPFPGHTVEWGVLLDDAGSIDIYETPEAAESAWREEGGLAVVVISTTVTAIPLGKRSDR